LGEGQGVRAVSGDGLLPSMRDFSTRLEKTDEGRLPHGKRSFDTA
jgi:hypothetical protein